MSEVVMRCPACSSEKLRSIYQRESHGKTWELAKCGECEQQFTTPFPTASEIAGFYAGDYHGELRHSGDSEAAFGGKYRRYTNWVKQFVASGGRTLDVGCSTGLLVKMLKDEGYRAEGVEFNERSVEWGKSNYGVSLRCGGLDTLPLETAAYDLVSLTDVLEHTENPLENLKKVRGLLRASGHALITFPDIDSFESRYLWHLSRVLGRGWLWATCHIPLHTWEFTPATARRMFSKAGFEVVGFRRSSARETSADPKLRVLMAPTKVVDWLPGLLGTQMEFMLRRV